MEYVNKSHITFWFEPFVARRNCHVIGIDMYYDGKNVVIDDTVFNVKLKEGESFVFVSIRETYIMFGFRFEFILSDGRMIAAPPAASIRAIECKEIKFELFTYTVSEPIRIIGLAVYYQECLIVKTACEPSMLQNLDVYNMNYTLEVDIPLNKALEMLKQCPLIKVN